MPYVTADPVLGELDEEKSDTCKPIRDPREDFEFAFLTRFTCTKGGAGKEMGRWHCGYYFTENTGRSKWLRSEPYPTLLVPLVVRCVWCMLQQVMYVKSTMGPVHQIYF